MSEVAPFHWPDTLAPVFVTRDLTVLRENHKPLPLRAVRLIELLPGCLYEIPLCDSNVHDGVRELRHGRILSLNLKVTRSLKGDDAGELAQCFVSYDGVYKARRGLGRIGRRGSSLEIPDLKKWSCALDEMMHASWELKREETGDRAKFKMVVAGIVNGHIEVRDQDKRGALELTRQASTRWNSEGDGSIPLLCLEGQGHLASRIQAVRGIGRRMSLREAVLEAYIDRLREIVMNVASAQEVRLADTWLASGTDRTPRKVREEASRLAAEALRLRQISARPFSGSFAHIAQDLETSAGLLREAADGRNGDTILRAKEGFSRAYRATKLRDAHWELEELLLQASILVDRRDMLHPVRREIWHHDLRAIHGRLTHDEPITGKPLDYGFKRPILKSVVPHVHLADVYLMGRIGTDLENVIYELKTACERF